MLDELSRLLGGIPIPGVIGVLGLALAQLGIQVAALVDLWRSHAVVGGRKWIWLLVILAGGLVGGVAYLAAGREREAVAPGPGVPAAGGGAPARVIELLYGDPAAGGRGEAVALAAPDEPEAVLRIEGLTKAFGETAALCGVDLAVREGEVFGFLGPNGAGKTTTLRILTGLITPTSGRALLFGRDIREASGTVRAQIGYLPDVPGFYPWMTAKELLTLIGRLQGLPPDALESRIPPLLDLVGLAGTDPPIGGFSRGMKQRLGIAQAMIHAPRLLLLDEPTSALDPLGRKEVLDTVTALRGRATVFFSSHILADVERVCDTVAILDRGRVVTQAGVAELRARDRAHRITVEVRGDVTVLLARLAEAPWLRGVERSGERLDLEVGDLEAAERAIPRAVADAGLGLHRMKAIEATLEDVFVDLVAAERS